MTVKTRVEDNEPMRCMYCQTTTEQHVDRARGAGWRVLMDNIICPLCWNAKTMRTPSGTPQPYDTPMF